MRRNQDTKIICCQLWLVAEPDQIVLRAACLKKPGADGKRSPRVEICIVNKLDRQAVKGGFDSIGFKSCNDVYLTVQGCNVGFMQLCDRNTIALRVYERGAGETLACGTGACAAVVAGCLQGLLDDTVRVILHGGELSIEWLGIDTPVLMTGPATTVFEGKIQI